jgi:hypothetical protein
MKLTQSTVITKYQSQSTFLSSTLIRKNQSTSFIFKYQTNKLQHLLHLFTFDQDVLDIVVSVYRVKLMVSLKGAAVDLLRLFRHIEQESRMRLVIDGGR